MDQGNAAVRDRAATERSRAGRAQRARQPRSGIGEKLIAGVPARIMRPRLVFAVCLVAIVCFGLVMVYSASSVEAMKEAGDAAYYVVRQAAFTATGLILIAVMCTRAFPWRALLRTEAVWGVWGVCFLLLLVVSVMGLGSGGAVRWISIGSLITIQPSEFMKVAIILLVGKLMSDYYEEETIDTGEFLTKLAIGVCVPLVLIFAQPDMGTTMIILVTVLAMLLLGRMSWKVLGAAIAAVVVAAILAIAIAPYRMERFLVMVDPWSDPYDSGYQATLAIMAFASGGLFGRGIGNSTMKYSYLPEAHNDYILAIIGEELGFVGTVIFFAVFALMIWSAFEIARQSPTHYGEWICEGAAVILMVQFLVNALGIIGVLPMTGKTMPFISYGGSSMLACLLLAGVILRVSLESGRSTVYTARRRRFAVMSEQDAVSSHMGRSTAGEPRARRSAEPSRTSASRSGFSVYDGTRGNARSDAGENRPAPRPAPLVRPGSGGYGRIDLGGSATERLRGTSGSRPQVRTRDSRRRDRHDR